MEKKNVILLTVIAIATLLITVVGATFAYFAATITNTGDDDGITETSIKSASSLALTYSDGETISVTNILPGWGETYDQEKTNTITVSNNTDLTISYEMKWQDVTNDFDTKDQDNLKYQAEVQTSWIEEDGHDADEHSSAGNITETTAPKTNNESFTTQTLKPGEQITYIVHVLYKYDADNIQDSQNRTFSAKLKIDQDSIKVTQPAA